MRRLDFHCKHISSFAKNCNGLQQLSENRDTLNNRTVHICRKSTVNPPLTINSFCYRKYSTTTSIQTMTRSLSFLKVHASQHSQSKSLSISSNLHFSDKKVNDLGCASESEIIDYLREKELNSIESHTQLKIQLPKYLFDNTKIGLRDNSSIVDVFINKKIGMVVIPELALGAKFENFKEILSMYHRKTKREIEKEKEKLPKLESILPESKKFLLLWNEAEPIESFEKPEYIKVMNEFGLPIKQFTQDLLVKFEARLHKVSPNDAIDSSCQLLFPIYYINGELIGVRRIYMTTDTKELKEETISTEKNNELTLNTFPHRLYQVHKSKANSVILVSSILDSITLIGNSPDDASIYPVALADSSLSSLPPEHLPFFEDVSLTFWLPNDTLNSANALQIFSKKFDEQRCSVVKRDLSQPWKWKMGKKGKGKEKNENISSFIKNNSKSCKNEFVTSFEHFREEVWNELSNPSLNSGVQWKRFPDLSKYLGGFRRGELTVFTGKTGKGKTTFLSEYSIDLCSQNVPTLWGSFEVKKTRLMKTQIKQFSKSPKVGENHKEFNKWADQFQKLPMHYLTFHGSEEVTFIS